MSSKDLNDSNQLSNNLSNGQEIKQVEEKETASLFPINLIVNKFKNAEADKGWKFD